MQTGQAILQFDAAVSQQIGRGRQKHLIPVPAGQTVAQALQALEIRLPQAGVVLVNGATHDLNHILQPGDTVRFLFQISGG